MVLGLLSGVVLWLFFGEEVGWFFTFTGTMGLVGLGVLVAVEFHFGWLLEYTDGATEGQDKEEGQYREQLSQD